MRCCCCWKISKRAWVETNQKQICEYKRRQSEYQVTRAPQYSISSHSSLFTVKLRPCNWTTGAELRRRRMLTAFKFQVVYRNNTLCRITSQLVRRSTTTLMELQPCVHLVVDYVRLTWHEVSKFNFCQRLGQTSGKNHGKPLIRAVLVGFLPRWETSPWS